MSDTEEHMVPKVGDDMLATDDEGDPIELEITDVGELDVASGLYKVTADDGDDYEVYWSDADEMWVHSEG